MSENKATDPAEPHVTDDAKARFREALEAKRASGHPSVKGGKRGKLAGHERDGAHQQKVFRRKSG